jgi:hypothetical protein
MPGDKAFHLDKDFQPLNMCEKEESEVNPQVSLMTEENMQALPPRNTIPREAFDYGDPIRDAAWFKKRCEALGMHFEANVYEVMAIHETGIRRKQYKAMLRKAKKKQPMAILSEPTILSF